LLDCFAVFWGFSPELWLPSFQAENASKLLDAKHKAKVAKKVDIGKLSSLNQRGSADTHMPKHATRSSTLGRLFSEAKEFIFPVDPDNEDETGNLPMVTLPTHSQSRQQHNNLAPGQRRRQPGHAGSESMKSHKPQAAHKDNRTQGEKHKPSQSFSLKGVGAAAGQRTPQRTPQQQHTSQGSGGAGRGPAGPPASVGDGAGAGGGYLHSQGVQAAACRSPPIGMQQISTHLESRFQGQSQGQGQVQRNATESAREGKQGDDEAESKPKPAFTI
jgi:hypothetical protein